MVLEFVPGGPIMDWVHTPDGGMFASPLTGAVLGEERADWAIADVLNGLACVPPHFLYPPVRLFVSVKNTQHEGGRQSSGDPATSVYMSPSSHFACHRRSDACVYTSRVPIPITYGRTAR